MASGEVLGFVPGIWDELAAGTPGSDAPVGVMSHPDSIHRTAGYVTRMSGGVGGERSRGLPLSRCVPGMAQNERGASPRAR
jgi:hypothetical protein